MALSNIFREPRREIIETALGLVALTPFFYVDYRFAHWAASFSDGVPFVLGLLLGALAIVASVVVLGGLVVFIHFVGEQVCAWFSDRGLDPRPKQRY